MAEQQLKSADREKRGKVLFCAGLDFLKYINNNLSCQAGDNVLIDAAGIIRNSFHESDIVARIGGDEFAVLADGINQEDIQKHLSRLKRNLDAYNGRTGNAYEISLSIGMKLYDPGNPCSLDELLTGADELMCEEKRLKGKMLV